MRPLTPYPPLPSPPIRRERGDVTWAMEARWCPVGCETSVGAQHAAPLRSLDNLHPMISTPSVDHPLKNHGGFLSVPPLPGDGSAMGEGARG
jgi:hypothetical protein